jgi:hypothetical protein
MEEKVVRESISWFRMIKMILNDSVSETTERLLLKNPFVPDMIHVLNPFRSYSDTKQLLHCMLCSLANISVVETLWYRWTVIGKTSLVGTYFSNLLEHLEGIDGKLKRAFTASVCSLNAYGMGLSQIEVVDTYSMNYKVAQTDSCEQLAFAPFPNRGLGAAATACKWKIGVLVCDGRKQQRHT